jgi:hypothetical protein
MSVSVGLGNGNRDQQLAHLNNLYQIAMGSMQAGIQIVSPKGLYALVSKMTTNAGFKNPEEFWQDPSTTPPAPPQENPMITVKKMELQADQQKFQAQSQFDQQQAQADAQIQLQIEQAKNQLKLQEIQANLELQAANDARDAEREQQKAMLDAQLESQKIEFEKWKAELQAQTQIYLAQLTAGSTQAVETNGNPENVSNALAVSIDGFKAAIEQMSKPKQIIRGPDGRAAGIM